MMRFWLFFLYLFASAKKREQLLLDDLNRYLRKKYKRREKSASYYISSPYSSISPPVLKVWNVDKRSNRVIGDNSAIHLKKTTNIDAGKKIPTPLPERVIWNPRPDAINSALFLTCPDHIYATLRKGKDIGEL